MKTNGENKIPRIICVGSNLESEIALKALVNINANIVSLVTRPSGDAGTVSDYVDLHEFCHKNNIKTIDTKNINNDVTLGEIKQNKPDYIFTLGWSQLFKDKLLSIPKQCTIGSHPTELPFGRGRAPVPWTILEDIRTSAVSFFKMDLNIDSGELLHQEFFHIPDNSYAIDLYNLVANSLANGFVLLYKKILENKLEVIGYPKKKVTHRAKRSPEDGLINFNKSATEINKLIRAVSSPYPGAYTYYNDKMIKVWRSSLEDVPVYSAIPGQIIDIKDDSLLVFTGKSAIWLYEITDNLGNPLKGYFFKIGSKFGYQYDDEIYKLRMEIEKLKKTTKR